MSITLHHFLAMGGYAMYVWPAYGITLLVFLGNLGFALYEKILIKKIIKRYLSSQRQSS